jgi:hypothetical protein
MFLPWLRRQRFAAPPAAACTNFHRVIDPVALPMQQASSSFIAMEFTRIASCAKMHGNPDGIPLGERGVIIEALAASGH